MVRLFTSLLGFCLMASSSWAAITHDATTTDVTGNNNVQNPSTTHTRGAVCPNAVAIISFAYQDSTPGTISALNYDGNAATSLCGVGEGCTNNAKGTGGANEFISLWIYKSPPAGTATVQAFGSEVLNDSSFRISTYCGVDQTTSTGTVVSANGASTTPTVNVSSATGELVVDAAVAGNQTFTGGAGQTERANLEVAGNHDHLGSEEPGAATTTMSWSAAGAIFWATIAAPIKPAPDGQPAHLRGGAVPGMNTLGLGGPLP